MTGKGNGTVARERPASTMPEVIERSDTSLLDLVDHVLEKGVHINGDLVIGLAGVDLIYLRLAAVLCPADRVFPEDYEK